MSLVPTNQIGAYLRKMAIDGYIIYTHTKDIQVMNKDLQRIARNRWATYYEHIHRLMYIANLAANIGEPEKAITALKKCAEYTEENSGIYADLLWNTGIIYLQMNDMANAVPYLKKALNIYAEIYEDEPELTQRKI